MFLYAFVLLECFFSINTLCNGFSLDTTRVVTVTASDADLVEQQLGYIPRNFDSVMARTSEGSPIAIKTYPLLRKKGSEDKPLLLSSLSASPFPTHYWLTCPEIARAIGEIERKGTIALIEDYLNLDCNFSKRQQLLHCHEQCGDDRWDCLTPLDRQFFLDHAEKDRTVARMKDMIQRGSGIAGTDYLATVNDDTGVLETVSIKCLHTHYAHFRATTSTKGLKNNGNGMEENPIGRIVHDLLLTKFPEVAL